jgi:ABC-type uncharacterized transport system permease subunit
MANSLVMSFLNAEGVKSNITVANIKDDLTEVVVSAAMDVIIAKNILSTTGGDLKFKDSAQIVNRAATDLVVK